MLDSTRMLSDDLSIEPFSTSSSAPRYLSSLLVRAAKDGIVPLNVIGAFFCRRRGMSGDVRRGEEGGQEGRGDREAPEDGCLSETILYLNYGVHNFVR